MTVYDLRKKTKASTGQKVTILGNNNRVEKLENRINDQEQKLDKILELLQNGNNLPNTDK
jgi:alanine racemase